jgi:hypothetical protein
MGTPSRSVIARESVVSLRRLLPLALVGRFGAAVAASTVHGAKESPSVHSDETPSKQFHSAVAETLASKNFTVHFAGQSTVYHAPTRSVEISPGSSGLGISFCHDRNELVRRFRLRAVVEGAKMLFLIPEAHPRLSVTFERQCPPEWWVLK